MSPPENFIHDHIVWSATMQPRIWSTTKFDMYYLTLFDYYMQNRLITGKTTSICSYTDCYMGNTYVS